VKYSRKKSSLHSAAWRSALTWLRQSFLSRSFDGLLQQDGARAHTSSAMITWLDKNIDSIFHWKTVHKFAEFVFQLKTFGALWPQQSMLIQRLKALDCRLCYAWRSISVTALQNIVSAMPDRMKAVINSKGDTILYWHYTRVTWRIAWHFVIVSLCSFLGVSMLLPAANLL